METPHITDAQLETMFSECPTITDYTDLFKECEKDSLTRVLATCAIAGWFRNLEINDFLEDDSATDC